MKAFIFLLLVLFTCKIGHAQNRETDSLKHELSIAKYDSNRVLIMANLCYAYANSDSDSALLFAKKGLTLAQKINFSKGEARVLRNQGRLYRILGDYPKGLELLFRALGVAKDHNHKYEEAVSLNIIGFIYSYLQDYSQAIHYLKSASEILAANPGLDENSFEYNLNVNMADTYRLSGQLDSALIYLQKAKTKIATSKRADETSRYYYALAYIQFKKGKQDSAFESLRKTTSLAKVFNSHRFLANSYNLMAGFFKNLNQADSSIYYSEKALIEARTIGYKDAVIEACKFLAEQYELKDIQKALYYRKIYDSVNEEVNGAKKVRDLQKTLSNEQERQREMEAQRIAEQTQLRQYAFLAGLGVLMLIAFILYRTNKQQKKANHLLHRQKEEINLQRDKAEKALTELKSTQAQLIQKEKLASLGELTAGIAHEIQNPLNFVNNFSELSVELVEEMQEELTKGDVEEAQAIADDLRQNLEKINHHGKRASGIVKGMLEHSRTSTGERELTDINQLAEEYLRLAYHGLKAKNQDFNSDYEFINDTNLPQLNVVPQEIGRVLLNLINNAFYAVNERAKQGEPNYQPKVTVLTKALPNWGGLDGPPRGSVEIRVKDNGTGIPDSIKAKIFQPFFTTKPTGEGTGLGLSLAYDIVTKGHGGTMEVESTEGQGTTFIVKLPIQTH
jgi:two-component system NtrC family sensor kinase